MGAPKRVDGQDHEGARGVHGAPALEATRDDQGRPWIRPVAGRQGVSAPSPPPTHAAVDAPKEATEGRAERPPEHASEDHGGAASDEEAGTPPESESQPNPRPVVDPAALDDRFDEGFVHRIAPVFKLLRLYSRLEVEGIEHVPEGPALLVANHTGWLGLDYAYTALSVYDARKRVVRGMAHHAWFMRPHIGSLAHRLGLYEVSKETMRALLDREDLVLIFPEGEKGAFKGEHERYHLQDFARGYIRVALAAGVPIVPVAIVGGEEANPSSRRIDSYEDLLNLSLPMPQNLFPRPVKWRISFLPPIRLEGGPEAVNDRDHVHEANERVRQRLQQEIARLVSVRGHPFL